MVETPAALHLVREEQPMSVWTAVGRVLRERPLRMVGRCRPRQITAPRLGLVPQHFPC